MNNEEFNSDWPLGPEALTDALALYDPLIWKENLPYKRLLQNPSLIIGRKGSGKTSLLRSVELRNQYDDGIIIKISSNVAFESFVKLVNSETKNVLFPESISDIWEYIFWTLFAVEISRKYNETGDENYDIINQFVWGLNVVDISNPDYIMNNSITSLKNYDLGSSLTEKCYSFDSNGISISILKDAISRYMEKNEKYGIILIDSIEDFRLDIDAMHPSLSGLIRAISLFQTPSYKCNIRCCIPAELYFIFLELSSNPNKDFANSQIVHWSAIELLSLSAYRLSEYIRINDDVVYSRNVSHYDFSKRQDVMKFWYSIFDTHIVNGMGIREDSLAYIMRHTQLLPRHILKILNEIFRGMTPSDIFEKKIDQKKIINAINEIEILITSDIISGYSQSFAPESENAPMMYARKVCEEVIKDLPFKFNVKEFRGVYKQNVTKGSIPYIFDDVDALRVLIEVGAVGRYIKTTGRYHIATFEYTSSHKLITNTSDDLCLHPLFFGTFGSKGMESDFCVYPYGADVDDVEYRERS